MITRLLKRLFRPSSRLDPDTEDNLPILGNIYTFEIAPFNEFSAPKTGRHAALKVIGMSGDMIAVAILDGIWDRPPTLEEAGQSSILQERRFKSEDTFAILKKRNMISSKNYLAVYGMIDEEWKPFRLIDFKRLGFLPVSSHEAKLARQTLGKSFAGLGTANYIAEGEWRWAHDRAALVAEVEKERSKEA